MGLVSEVISGLFGGVSQQPAPLRLDNQCQSLVNGYPSIVHGLEKRPGTEFISLLTSNAGTNIGVHLINRDASEQYIALFTGDAGEPVEVYTLDGTKCTIRYGTLNAEGGGFVQDLTVKNYLASSAPSAEIRATTIADYTIVSNKAKTCAMSGSPTSTQAPLAIMWVKSGQPQTSYEVYINGTRWGYAVTGSSSYSAESIAITLYNTLIGLQGVDSNWQVERYLATILVYRTDGADFTFSVHDSYGDQALVGVKGQTQKFSDLPTRLRGPAVGRVVKVSGEPSDDYDDYFLKFVQTDDDGFGTQGLWKETVKEGIDNTFNDTTLPHRMVRTGVNEFTVAPIIWEDRKVGDENSAPVPSFIGNVIEDVFTYKNRLGILSGENVILSKASEFFDFWPTTATEVLDDDPIDVAVSGNEVSILRYGLPWNEQLLLFADQLQFILTSGSELLTPKSAAVDISTRFELNKSSRPVGVGPNVFFMEPTGNSSALREYFIQPDSLLNDAANVSAHAPTYLPANIQTLFASAPFETVFAAPAASTDLYFYKFFWQGDEKAQSAWGKWTFDSQVLGGAALQNYVFLIMKKGSQVSLERVNLEHVSTGALPFRVHLDRQKALTGVFAGGVTTWTLPYTDASADIVVIDPATGARLAGTTRPLSTTVEVAGDYSGAAYHVGKNYEFRQRFSEWGVKSPSANTHNLQGRLQLRFLTLHFINTGYFTVEVTAGARSAKTFAMTGVVVGQSIFGTPTLLSGTQRVLIQGNAKTTVIELVNNTHLPCQFSTAAWEGEYIVRNQPL